MAGTPTKTKAISVTFNDGSALVLEYTGDFGLPGTAENTSVRLATNQQVYRESVENDEYEDYTINLLPSSSVRSRLITAKEAGTVCTLTFASTAPVGDTWSETHNVKVKQVQATSGDVEDLQNSMPVVFEIITVPDAPSS